MKNKQKTYMWGFNIPKIMANFEVFCQVILLSINPLISEHLSNGKINIKEYLLSVAVSSSCQMPKEWKSKSASLKVEIDKALKGKKLLGFVMLMVNKNQLDKREFESLLQQNSNSCGR